MRLHRRLLITTIDGETVVEWHHNMAMKVMHCPLRLPVRGGRRLRCAVGELRGRRPPVAAAATAAVVVGPLPLLLHVGDPTGLGLAIADLLDLKALNITL